jgi:hypothetical protein
MLSVTGEAVDVRLARLRQNAAVHARGVDSIIEQQVDGPAAANLMKAGGGRSICEAVLRLLETVVGTGGG